MKTRTNRKIYIVNKKRNKRDFQFYMHQFVESAINCGLTPISEYQYLTRYKIRRIIKEILHIIPITPSASFKKNVLVCSQGSSILYNSIPYFFSYNIIPMLWDCWTECWDSLFNQLKILKCKICFVTSSQVADIISEKFPHMKVFWIPEGIDMSDYQKGEELKNREYCLYELGRQNQKYHEIVIEAYRENIITSYFRNEYNEDGSLKKLAFPTYQSLVKELPNIKIIISFPRSDTHPETAGNIETLTQRYWEAMLCGCLIIGKAPKELIEIIGYDPVINVDWENPKIQLGNIVNNIDNYQKLADKNYETALMHASWDYRMKKIKEVLSDL